MDATEWPSQTHLDKLRAEGIVPYSRFSTLALSILLLLVFVVLKREILAEQLNTMFGAHLELGQAFRLLAQLVLDLVLIPALLISALATLIVLLQTKFLFRWANLGARLDRLYPFSASSSAPIFFCLLSAAFIFSLSLVVAGALLFFQIVNILQLLNNDRARFIAEINKEIGASFPFIAVLLFGVAAFAWTFSKLAFRYRHRMSRKEKEEEQRSHG